MNASRLRWFGHKKRRETTDIIKSVVECQPEGGRSKKRWLGGLWYTTRYRYIGSDRPRGNDQEPIVTTLTRTEL